MTDSFTLSGPETIFSVTFGEWVPSGATPGDVTWAIGSMAYGSDLDSGTGVSLTSSLFCAAGAGCGDGDYDVYASTFTLDLPLSGGSYWLTLDDATTSGGLAFWDQNAGPSQAEATCCGSGFLSNSFTVEGTPEPGSFGLVGSGFVLLLAAGLRHARKRFSR